LGFGDLEFDPGAATPTAFVEGRFPFCDQGVVLAAPQKFVALVRIYAELRLPFDAALDAAEAHGGQGRALTGVTLSRSVRRFF
jgi:hypothetical protein